MLNRGSPRARGRSQEILWAAASCTSADGLPVIDRAALKSRAEQNRAEQGTAEQNVTQKSRAEKNRKEQSKVIDRGAPPPQCCQQGCRSPGTSIPFNRPNILFGHLHICAKRLSATFPSVTCILYIPNSSSIETTCILLSLTHICPKMLAANSL